MCSCGGVHFLVAEHPAGRDHLERRPEFFEARTCTGEVCVRSSRPSFSQNVSCMSRAGWSRGNIERVEVVVFGLDLGTVQDREAQRDEQLFELPLHLRDRMQASRANAGRGRGEVDPFRFEARVERRRNRARALRCSNTLSNSCLYCVQKLADSGALLRRELAELLADHGELALAAQNFDAHCFNGFEGRSGSRCRASAASCSSR